MSCGYHMDTMWQSARMVDGSFIEIDAYRCDLRLGVGHNCRQLWTAGIEMHVRGLLQKHEALAEQLCHPEVLQGSGYNDLSREMSRLQPTVDLYKKILVKQKDIAEIAELIIDDASFSSEIEEDLKISQIEISNMQNDLIDLLIPNEDENVNGVVLEIRAGTGGQEAAHFASEILNMYERYANFRQWSYEVLQRSNATSTDITKEATVSVMGSGVFHMLKSEAGVHRVQRIPVTDSHSRIHTSTITVAVLPQPEKIDSTVSMKDLKVETFRSSGPGGQHVNKTDSAVRMTHLPSGMVVSCQEDRSQLKNRAKALKLLAAKLYHRDRIAADAHRSYERRSQIGTGERHERIRTYNFMQDRITDHRAEVTVAGIHTFLEGQVTFHDLLVDINKMNRMQAILKFDPNKIK